MRLIDADALKRWLETNKENANPLDYNTKEIYSECITMVENMEAIEAEPVRHGKRMMITDSNNYGVCSVCFRQDYIDSLATHCRYCGEKMNLEGREGITEKQRALIEDMNEFCREKFDLENSHTKAAAREYISRNIEEFKLLTRSAWALEHGYF